MSIRAAIPAVFGSYQIDIDAAGEPVQLGAGAFGTIYRATDQTDGRPVALKLIQDSIASQQTVRDRFLAETSEQSRLLNHIGIVRVLDSNEQDGILWFAMEYCAGGDLGKYVSEKGPLTVVEALKVGKTVADALVYAHGYGICHRDIKPSNILLEKTGALLPAKLSDFGLVKRIRQDDSLTCSKSGGYVGTIQFSSPEQIREDKTLDTRTDIYSLGLTLWHTLAGGFPLTKPDGSALNRWELMQEHTEQHEFRDRLPANLPACVRDLLGTMMARDPGARYATCSQVVMAIEKCLQTIGSSPGSAARAATRPLPLNEFYSADTVTAQCPLGTLCKGRDVKTRRPVELLYLFPSLSPDDVRTIRRHLGALKRAPHTHLSPIQWGEFREGCVLVRQLPEQAVSLQEWISRAGRPSLAGVVPLLISLASAVDHAATLGLPGLEDSPHAISVIPGEGAKLPHPVITPRLCIPAAASPPAASAAGNTMVNQHTRLSVLDGSEGRAFSAPSCFAALAYWILAARKVADGAFMAPGVYGPTDRLKRGGNDVLRDSIAGLKAGTAADILRRLCEVEGIPFTWEFPVVAIPPAPSSAATGSPWPVPSTASPPPTARTSASHAAPLSGSSSTSASSPGLSGSAGQSSGPNISANKALLRSLLETIEETERQADAKIQEALARERAEQDARERQKLEEEARLRREFEQRMKEQAEQAEQARTAQKVERRKREEAELKAAEAAREAAEARRRMEDEYARREAEREELERAARAKAEAEAAEKLTGDQEARAQLDQELAAEREARRLLEQQLTQLSRQTEFVARQRKAAQERAEREDASAQDHAKAERLAEAEAKLRDEQQSKLDEALNVIARLQQKLEDAKTLAREAAVAQNASAEDVARLASIEAERKSAADEGARRANEIQRAREEAQKLADAEKAHFELARKRREEEEAANHAAAERARADRAAAIAAEKRRIIEEKARQEEELHAEQARLRAIEEERAAAAAAQRAADEQKAAAFRKQHQGSPRKVALIATLAALLALGGGAAWYFLGRLKPIEPLPRLSLTLSKVARDVHYEKDQPAIDEDFDVFCTKNGPDWTITLDRRVGSIASAYPKEIVLLIDGFKESIPLGEGDRFPVPENAHFEISNQSGVRCELVLIPQSTTQSGLGAPISLPISESRSLQPIPKRVPQGDYRLKWARVGVAPSSGGESSTGEWRIVEPVGSEIKDKIVSVGKKYKLALTFTGDFPESEVPGEILDQQYLKDIEHYEIKKNRLSSLRVEIPAVLSFTHAGIKLRKPDSSKVIRLFFTPLAYHLSSLDYCKSNTVLWELLDQEAKDIYKRYWKGGMGREENGTSVIEKGSPEVIAPVRATRDSAATVSADLYRFMEKLRDIEKPLVSIEHTATLTKRNLVTGKDEDFRRYFMNFELNSGKAFWAFYSPNFSQLSSDLALTSPEEQNTACKEETLQMQEALKPVVVEPMNSADYGLSIDGEAVVRLQSGKIIKVAGRK